MDIRKTKDLRTRRTQNTLVFARMKIYKKGIKRPIKNRARRNFLRFTFPSRHHFHAFMHISIFPNWNALGLVMSVLPSIRMFVLSSYRIVLDQIWKNSSLWSWGSAVWIISDNSFPCLATTTSDAIIPLVTSSIPAFVFLLSYPPVPFFLSKNACILPANEYTQNILNDVSPSYFSSSSASLHPS